MVAVRFDGGLPVEWDGRRAEFMAFTSSLAISLSCLLVVSLALQILIHFSTVSFLSANNFFLVPFSRIPRTTRSLSKLSCSVPKSHVLIKECKAVKYESNDSPCCWGGWEHNIKEKRRLSLNTLNLFNFVRHQYL